MYKAKQYFLQLYIYYYYVMSRPRSIIFISRSQQPDRSSLLFPRRYDIVVYGRFRKFARSNDGTESAVYNLRTLESKTKKRRRALGMTLYSYVPTYYMVGTCLHVSSRPVDNLLTLNSSRFLFSVRDVLDPSDSSDHDDGPVNPWQMAGVLSVRSAFAAKTIP